MVWDMRFVATDRERSQPSTWMSELRLSNEHITSIDYFSSDFRDLMNLLIAQWITKYKHFIFLVINT